jgi:hypothetical protein
MHNIVCTQIIITHARVYTKVNDYASFSVSDTTQNSNLHNSAGVPPEPKETDENSNSLENNNNGVPPEPIEIDENSNFKNNGVPPESTETDVHV